ncbi:SLC13 family permease [Spirosoma flavum]|uniref:SLC13 family permease n=1 Tax=Spirosoma flavum TaxID=2048557 RepID=A0ABW6AL96_9BACT
MGISEIIHADKDEQDRKYYTAAYVLSKVDIPSILFFLGILLAVSALEATDMLKNVAVSLNQTIANIDLIVLIIGIASAVVDNVPIVAAVVGMYDLNTFPPDAKLWEFLAYCAERVAVYWLLVQRLVWRLWVWNGWDLAGTFAELVVWPC